MVRGSFGLHPPLSVSTTFYDAKRSVSQGLNKVKCLKAWEKVAQGNAKKIIETADFLSLDKHF